MNNYYVLEIFESTQAGTNSLSLGLKPQRVAPPPPKSDKLSVSII